MLGQLKEIIVAGARNRAGSAIAESPLATMTDKTLTGPQKLQKLIEDAPQRPRDYSKGNGVEMTAPEARRPAPSRQQPDAPFAPKFQMPQLKPLSQQILEVMNAVPQ